MIDNNEKFSIEELEANLEVEDLSEDQDMEYYIIKQERPSTVEGSGSSS